MTRAKDTILSGKAFSIGKNAPMLDLQQGGQMGYHPDYPNYISNAAYISQNLIAFLIEPPRGFQDLDNPDKLVATLKALIELHSKSIEGLQSTLEVEWSETPFGGAGEMQQDVTNVTRTRSTPTHVWAEKYGKPINAFLEYWIVNLLMDPNTKRPGVVTRGIRQPTDLLPDYTSATVLYVEPDPTGTRVQCAWLCSNMKPKTGGEVTGRRDINAPGEGREYSVEFSSITQVGVGVDQLAQDMLDALIQIGANPYLAPAMATAVSADVRASTSGYAEQMADLAANAVAP